MICSFLFLFAQFINTFATGDLEKTHRELQQIKRRIYASLVANALTDINYDHPIRF